LTGIKVVVRQCETRCEAEGAVTVVDALVKSIPTPVETLSKGIPGYIMKNAPGQDWRSRYDQEQNIVIINSGHRDFMYANREKTRKLRYICRLFVKELVLHNFSGMQPGQILERMVELSLYTEDNLR
jgi:hypothetical protein